MNQIFPLANMSPLIRVMTIIVLLVPVFGLIYGIIVNQKIYLVVAGLLVILYLIVWLWCRPSHFIISSHYLTVKFPAWSRNIPLTDLGEIRLLDQETFGQEFGLAIRIGVGGLWGGFGWLWTSRGGFLEFYISRNDDLVLIENFTGNNLLLTPDKPLEMIEKITEFKNISNNQN
jgi:hypothetical protein